MRKIDRNDRVLMICFGVAFAMLGLSYASVPLYRIFCQVTGFAGTPRTYSEASIEVASGSIEVRFDANVGQGLPWEFKPRDGKTTVRLGENAQIFYVARNTGSQAVAGTATFNVTPLKAAKYFNKVQCFCFTRQELKAGQTADLGVSFFVDPAIATDPATKDVSAITLSYTFFPALPETGKIAAVSPR
jgi:cytochrome c oxidase assembly protein subunit 11